MNPVFMVCYNNLALTKKTIASVLSQDIPVELIVVNNGSTDGTREWLNDLQVFCDNVLVSHHEENISPLKIGNMWYQRLFEDNDYVLGIPNDAVLPMNCYSELLKWPRGFVSASDIGDGEIQERPAKAVSENTPMAVMLTRKWAWQAIMARDGYFFDERIFMYVSDCDLALRMASCGIRGVQLDVPFQHVSSATIKNAAPLERRKMEIKADEDRAYFERKWGFKCTDLEYGQRACDINFTGANNG